MTNKEQEDETRLGHDPLEWLEDDELEASLTDEEPSANAVPSAEKEPLADQAPATEEEVAATESSEEEVVAASSEIDPEPTEAVSSMQEAEVEVQLPEKLMIQAVEELHRQWLPLVDNGNLEKLTIEGSQVKEVDAAGVQLLFALVQDVSGRGCTVSLVGIDENLKRHLQLAGLEDYFGPFIHAA